MANKRCKYGRVQGGPRKGECRTRKLSGAAAKKRRTKKNAVGKKASGSGRFCLMKRTVEGRSSTRCYSSQSDLTNAVSRLIERGGGKTLYRSIMLYSKKRA